MKKRGIKKFFNLLGGTILFVLLIGGAFSVDLIFGIGFLLGFVLALYNKTIEKNFLIPVFIFIGGLLIRISLSFIPSLLEEQDYISLGISLVLFLTILIIGIRVQKG